MSNRSMLTRFLIGAANTVEQVAARAVATLGSDSAADHPSLSPVEDPKVTAVQRAQRAAARAGDHKLARDLADVEIHLRRRSGKTDGSLIPTHHDRSASGAKLEGMRRDLLAKTPRPDPSTLD